MDVTDCHIDDPKIRHDHKVFSGLVSQAEFLLTGGNYPAAAVSARIAAEYASFRHPGIFVSRRLEAVLQEIGRSTMPDSVLNRPGICFDHKRQHIVHVISFARPVGGDTRYLWRWIEKDRQRRHSVVISGAQRENVPGHLAASVARSGGVVHVIDPDISDPVKRARTLRGHVRTADLIVLHLYPEDILPLIAFAHRDNLPPVVYITHADERFWLGATISDVFAHMRQSGITLAGERSGIDTERICLLPIPLPPRQRSLTRREAKSMLDLPEDAVLLLSIAREMKFRQHSGVSFAEAVLPVIERHSNVTLIVVGPENRDLWGKGQQRNHERLRAVGRRADTAVFYEAADIYLDSFPFSSNTSLLEAGNLGLPLVSYFPHSPGSEVLGAGSPGIDEALLRFTDLEAFQGALSDLVEHPDRRRRIGELGRDSIINHHDGPAWDTCLENLYKKAFTIDRNHSQPCPDLSPPGELDAVLNRLYPHFSLTAIIEDNVKQLPLKLRINVLARLIRVSCSFPFGLFLPDRLSALLSPVMRGWRTLPFVAGWVKARA